MTAFTVKSRSVLVPGLNYRQCLLSFFFSLVIALGAQLSMPLSPIPVTFQSFMIFAVALSCGARIAVLAVSFYLLEGALGLPVFANFQGGFAYLIGPSAGYLWGFLPAAALCGWLMSHGAAKHRFTIALSLCASNLVLFACGLSVLSAFFGWHAAWQWGAAPFIGVFFAKLIALTLMTPYCWRHGTSK